MESPAPSWFKMPSRRRASLFYGFLAGAPLALLLSFQLHHLSSHHADFHISIDRARMIDLAHQTAARLKLDTSGWSAEARTHINSDLVEYFRRMPAPQSAPARRFAGELGGEVLLVNPAKDAGLHVIIGADGTELGYRLTGSILKPAEPIGEEEMLVFSLIELKALFADMALEGIGTPEITARETDGVTGIRRITFRPLARQYPDILFTVNLDFLGGRIIARQILSETSEPFIERVLRTSRSTETMGNVFRLLIYLFLSLYAAFRFSRRIADGEAPIRRAVALAVFLPVLGIIFFFIDPALGMTEMKPQNFAVAGLFAALLSKLFSFLIQGIVIGMSYGGGEGFIREAFQGRLVSLDAALKGRILSSNVGQAVVTGAAAGCWAVLAYHLLLPLTGNPISPVVLANTAIGFSKHPWFFYFVKSSIIAVFGATVCLLVPVLIFGRLAQRPRLLILALLLTAALIGPVDESYRVDSGDFWFRSALMAATLVGTFFLWDFVAAVSACTFVGLLAPMADMLDRMPAWHAYVPLAIGQAAVTLLPMLYAALRGKPCKEEELLPHYARVQAERLALQAELAAAREAQLRLLPTALPETPGVSLAASCIPAREVAGDFYDFIEMGDGNLGVIVAEGGNDGLASALTIALAKGFLMFESGSGQDVHRTLAELEKVLGDNLQRESGRTAIALLVVDPTQRHVTMARVGEFPRIIALNSSGATRDASLLLDAADGIVRGSLRLNPGDSLLIFTDGLARLAAQRDQGEIEQILRRAAGFSGVSSAAAIHETLLAALLPKDRRAPADIADDITAVVISFQDLAAVDRQEVA